MDALTKSGKQRQFKTGGDVCVHPCFAPTNVVISQFEPRKVDIQNSGRIYSTLGLFPAINRPFGHNEEASWRGKHGSELLVLRTRSITHYIDILEVQPKCLTSSILIFNGWCHFDACFVCVWHSKLSDKRLATTHFDGLISLANSLQIAILSTSEPSQWVVLTFPKEYPEVAINSSIISLAELSVWKVISSKRWCSTFAFVFGFIMCSEYCYVCTPPYSTRSRLSKDFSTRKEWLWQCGPRTRCVC